MVRAVQKHAPAKPTLPADTVRGNARSKFAQCLEQALKELKETGADAAELKNPAETAAAIESECQKLYGKSPLGGGWLLSPPSPDPLSTLTCYCSCSVTRAPCKLSLRLLFPTSSLRADQRYRRAIKASTESSVVAAFCQERSQPSRAVAGVGGRSSDLWSVGSNVPRAMLSFDPPSANGRWRSAALPSHCLQRACVWGVRRLARSCRSREFGA